MSRAQLRESFNEVGSPRYTCTDAKLGYERDGGKEWQVLVFSGTGSDGNAFEVKSDRLAGDIDVFAAAKVVAQRLLDQQEPLT